MTRDDYKFWLFCDNVPYNITPMSYNDSTRCGGIVCVTDLHVRAVISSIFDKILGGGFACSPIGSASIERFKDVGSDNAFVLNTDYPDFTLDQTDQETKNRYAYLRELVGDYGGIGRFHNLSYVADKQSKMEAIYISCDDNYHFIPISLVFSDEQYKEIKQKLDSDIGRGFYEEMTDLGVYNPNYGVDSRYGSDLRIVCIPRRNSNAKTITTTIDGNARRVT